MVGLLQLCSEDDSEHRKANGDGQTQVQVEQDGADECHEPHQLHGETLTVIGVRSATISNKADGVFRQIKSHQVNSVGFP